MNNKIRQPEPFLMATLPVAFAALLAIVGLTVPPVVVGDIAPDPLSGGVNFSGSTVADRGIGFIPR